MEWKYFFRLVFDYKLNIQVDDFLWGFEKFFRIEVYGGGNCELFLNMDLVLLFNCAAIFKLSFLKLSQKYKLFLEELSEAP